VRRTGGHRDLATFSHASELRVFDEESGVFNGRAAIASDEARAFEHCYAAGCRLGRYLPEATRNQQEASCQK
jgi:hypothetical protein